MKDLPDQNANHVPNFELGELLNFLSQPSRVAQVNPTFHRRSIQLCCVCISFSGCASSFVERERVAEIAEGWDRVGFSTVMPWGKWTVYLDIAGFCGGLDS